MTHNIFIRVFFSASNLNALAAMFLSYSLGSLAGTAVFFVAVLIGGMNKYHALRYNQRFDHLLLRRLTDPSITAQILMAAAFINAVMAGFDMIGDEANRMQNFVLMLAWTFGVLGDDALRRNDKTNFANDYLKKERPLWLRTFLYTTRNPIFYYLFVNIFFSLGVFLSPDGQSGFVVPFVLTVGCLMVSIGGIIYSIFRSKKFLQGKILPQDVNNGTNNIIISTVNLQLMIMAFYQSMIWMVVAQIIFIIANIILIYETRYALAKENI